MKREASLSAPVPRDEAFWLKQQQRREKQMGQPCCTQSGFSWTMIDVPGKFAVVVHGEYDCLNCFHHHTGRSAVQFYSTRLTEEMLTTGRTEEALRTCLELVAEVEQPDFVLVLGTCPVEVIGDRFGGVVEEVAARTGVHMVPLRTHGLALSSQPRMLDWLFKTLATLPAGPEPAPSGRPRINLVGAPSTRRGAALEAVAALAAAGVDVNGAFPDGTSTDRWRAIRYASDAFVVDTTMFPRLIDCLGEFGQRIHEVPLPIGVGPTSRFYDTIANALGLDLGAALADLRAPAEAAIASFRRDHRGLKLAVAIRMLNNYRSEALAYDGLGEIAAYQELGFDVELLVQGPPEPTAMALVGEKLAARGCNLPFRPFPGPYALAEVLRDGRFDVCVAADSSRDAAQTAGIPMLRTGALAPWLGGAARNVRTLRAALRSGR